jgi:hypothetical protein
LDIYECKTLDRKLSDDFGDRTGSDHRMTYDLARDLLNDMYKKYPEMRKYYRSPDDMLNTSFEVAQSNGSWQLIQPTHGPIGPR